MIHKSKWSIHVPKQTLPTFLFGSPTAPLPDKPCYIDAERPDRYVLKYEDYRVWAQRLAAGLRAAGLQKGDTLMLYSGNSIFFPIVLMGTIMASGIFTGANPTYNAREVAYQLDNSQAKFLLCADASLETALEAIKITGLGKDRLFVFDQGRDTFDGNGRGRLGCKHWTTLLKSPEEGRKFQWVDGEDVFDDTIALNYSSGTTGLPKGWLQSTLSLKNHCSAFKGNVISRVLNRFRGRNYAQKLCFQLPSTHGAHGDAHRIRRKASKVQMAEYDAHVSRSGADYLLCRRTFKTNTGLRHAQI